MRPATLSCMAQGDVDITASACVEAQMDDRCFCPKAAQALVEMNGCALKRVNDQLPTLKARAAGMLRQSPERRYAGPALRVANERRARRVDEIEADLRKGTSPPPEEVAAAVLARREEESVPRKKLDEVCRVCGKPLDSRSVGGAHAGCKARSERVRETARKAPQEEQPQMAEPTPLPIRDVLAQAAPRNPFDEPTPLPDPKPLPGVDFSKEWEKGLDKLAQARTIDEPRLPNVKALPHDYLIACVAEVRRRLADFEAQHVHEKCCHAVIETTKDATA